MARRAGRHAEIRLACLAMGESGPLDGDVRRGIRLNPLRHMATLNIQSLQFELPVCHQLRAPKEANISATISATRRVHHRSERGITVIDTTINDSPTLTADCHERSRNCAENGRRIS